MEEKFECYVEIPVYKEKNKNKKPNSKLHLFFFLIFVFIPYFKQLDHPNKNVLKNLSRQILYNNLQNPSILNHLIEKYGSEAIESYKTSINVMDKKSNTVLASHFSMNRFLSDEKNDSCSSEYPQVAVKADPNSKQVDQSNFEEDLEEILVKIDDSLTVKVENEILQNSNKIFKKKTICKSSPIKKQKASLSDFLNSNKLHQEILKAGARIFLLEYVISYLTHSKIQTKKQVYLKLLAKLMESIHKRVIL